VPEIPPEAVRLALAARAHALIDRPDPMVLSDEALTREMLEAAAPLIAAAERSRIIAKARELGATYPVTLDPPAGSERAATRTVFPFADYLEDIP